MEKNSQVEDIESKLSLHDDVDFSENGIWPKPLVCIKNFPRSGTTYLRQNLKINNFFVVKKKWNVERNINQPNPVTVLRNPKDCIVSNIVMSPLKGKDSDIILKGFIGQTNEYNMFLDSLLLDIDNRTTYTFDQLENNPKEVLESINKIYSLGLVKNFNFLNKIPPRNIVFNYRMDKIELFLPSSKTEKNYNITLNEFERAVDLSSINDKYEALIKIIKNKQKDLGIQIWQKNFYNVILEQKKLLLWLYLDLKGK